MQITIFADDSELNFFVLNDGRISISHVKNLGLGNELSEFIITQKEFERILKFINESIIANNE
jgi:hypothetical protein